MRIVFFLLLFLLSVNGWGACQPWYLYSYGSSVQRCSSGEYMPTGVTCEWVSCSTLPGNNCYHYAEGFSGTIRCTDYAQAGGYWHNCKICDDQPDPCDSYRTQCEQAKGVFSGSANNGCCIATCNQCGALKDAVSQKSQICCNRGMAPPDQARQCRVEARATCGMNWSTFLSNDNEFSCQSPSASAEASQRYADQCFDNSSSSTSDPSSSSGGGGSSGGDCPECPILEEILSTLTDQKGTVEEIYRCLSVPEMCNLGGDSLPPWVREKMDQIIYFDSVTTNRAESIDSVVRVIMESQKSLVISDSLTRETIKDGVDSIVNAISNDDSLGEYIDRIANLIGTNSQMLSHHLDSIKERIPGSILDSILANQKSMFGSFDSAFSNIGNGYEKIDNITDSAIKYFNQGFHYDSVYSSVYRDSLGEIHEAINSATSTLRGDLSDLRGAIASFDSSVSREIDSLLGVFSPGGVDTGAVGYGSGFVAEGDRFGDSLARAVGWLGGLDGVNHDSIFGAAGFDSIAVDSVGRAVDDSLIFIADSLNNILVSQNDSIKNNLPSTLDAYSDSLIAYSPFASFDSLIFGQLGAKIPNSNQCPDDCNKWSISLPRFGLFNFTIDYGLCLGRATLGGMNVLGFIRLLLRIVVVWSCIWIVFNALTRRRD